MASGETSDNAPKPFRAPRRSRTEAEAREGDVGNALRSVYQTTVSEDIPADLLDLLGKLD